MSSLASYLNLISELFWLTQVIVQRQIERTNSYSSTVFVLLSALNRFPVTAPCYTASHLYVSLPVLSVSACTVDQSHTHSRTIESAIFPYTAQRSILTELLCGYKFLVSIAVPDSGTQRPLQSPPPRCPFFLSQVTRQQRASFGDGRFYVTRLSIYISLLELSGYCVTARATIWLLNLRCSNSGLSTTNLDPAFFPDPTLHNLDSRSKRKGSCSHHIRFVNHATSHNES